MKTILKDIFDDGTLTNFEPLDPKVYEYVLLPTYDDLMDWDKRVLVLYNDQPILTVARANATEGWVDARIVRAVWGDKIYYLKENDYDKNLFPLTVKIYGKVQIILLDNDNKPLKRAIF